MDLNELLTKARKLLKERSDSLQKDVRYCIIRNVSTPDWPAPLPALLYCFATIDLLGSLYGGDAKSPTGISQRSLNYMIDVMLYPKDKAELLQKVFRHKVVHLAQLKPITKLNDKQYCWEYHHDNRNIHLDVVSIEQDKFWFRVSIWSLVEDIVYSIFKPNGYLHRLEKEKDLRTKFETAYNQIFEQ